MSTDPAAGRARPAAPDRDPVPAAADPDAARDEPAADPGRDPALDGFAADPRWNGWMATALTLAANAEATGDVPVGAVVVDETGAVVGQGWNAREAGDPTAHAEVVALRAAAAARGRWRLDGCTLVVTLEPCVMCAGAALAARVDRIVLGAWDDKAGACGSVRDVVRDPRALHKAEVVGGVRGAECAQILRDFFVRRRLG